MATLFSAARGQKAYLGSKRVHTVYCKVSQGRACRPLDLDVRVLEEEHDGLQRVTVDLSYICRSISSRIGEVPDRVQGTSLGDLGEGQARRSLQVDVIRVNKRAQGTEGFAGEEVGVIALRQVSEG